MTSWRTMTLLVMALLLAWWLYPHARRPMPAPGATPPIELTLWVPGSANDATRTACDWFERKTGGKYKVLIGNATVRDQTADATRFLLGVAGGAPPDLIYYDRFAVVEAASRGAFRALNDLISRDLSLPDAVQAENFYDPMWQEPRFNGQQYGIPNSVDVRALILNDDTLERAGFKNAAGAIVAPRTWEQLCRKKAHVHAAVAGNTVTLGANFILGALGEARRSADPIVAGDIVALVVGEEVFRAHVAGVLADGTLKVSPTREDGEKVATIPSAFNGPNVEAKVYDRESYAIKLTRFDDNGNMLTAGFSPLYGNSWLYLFGWQNGADFMSADGTRCLLDDATVEGALQFIVDCYDAMGGYKRVKAFEGGFQQGAQDSFLLGKVAMRIDGNWYLNTIAAYRPDMRFSVVPAPIPADRFAAGVRPITWAGGWAYAIPATAKYQDGAWELLKFLVSPEGQRAQVDVNAGIARGKGQPFLPPLSPDRRVQQENRSRYMVNNPQVTPRLLAAYDQYVALLPDSKYRPVTPVGQKLWNEHATATEKACYHTYDAHTALHIGTRNVQHALDRYLKPPEGFRVNWNFLGGAYAAVVITGIVGVIWAERRYRARGLGKRDWIAGYIGISPWLLGFLIFSLGPILFSLVISFCSWDILNEARFTGLDNYRQLLGSYTDSLTGERVANDPEFWVSLKNTAFMFLAVPLGIALGLGIAMLLNAGVRGMAFFRTLYYLPAIVPSVASFLIWMWVFDDQRGILNMSLRALGMSDPPKWLQSQEWSKPALIIMGLWGVGGGMLIWLAGLKNIPQQLYEAAEIDGAGAVGKFIHVTLPMLSPYIFFNFVLGLIGTFQVFESAYMMTNGGPSDSTLFYAYKLFNEAFRYLNMGTAAAMAWIMFVIVLALTLLNLWAGKRWVHYD